MKVRHTVKEMLPMLAATGPWPRALFGLAGAAMGAAFAWPVRVDPAPERPAPPASAPRGEPALLRPLFDPERRDWTARGSREAVLEGEPRRPVLTLRGIVVDGTAARALIDDGGGDPRWLAQGEGRDGWHVTAIAADRVTLDQNGRPYIAEFMGSPATLRPLPLAPALRR